MAKRIKIGLYNLGMRKVALYGRSGTGAEFYAGPSNGTAEIVVGLDGDWRDVIVRIVHEAQEMVFANMGLRFSPSPDYARDAAG